MGALRGGLALTTPPGGSSNRDNIALGVDGVRSRTPEVPVLISTGGNGRQSRTVAR